eukprot:6192827-Pleurochrysis_carterae.AAC.2
MAGAADLEARFRLVHVLWHRQCQALWRRRQAVSARTCSTAHAGRCLYSAPRAIALAVPLFPEYRGARRSSTHSGEAAARRQVASQSSRRATRERCFHQDGESTEGKQSASPERLGAITRT